MEFLNAALVFLGCLYCLLFSLCCVLQRRRCSHASRHGNWPPEPGVSILITARNESWRIRECIASLERLDYPESMHEVLFVDDGSSDNTAEIISEAVRGRPHWRLLPFHKPPGATGVMPAIAHGIKHARHDIILRTDADCKVQPGWLHSMTAKFGKETAMVIGFCNLEVGKGPLQGFLAFDNLVSGLLNGSFARMGYPIGCSGGNLAFRKSAFLAVGGFADISRHRTGEDTHLAQLFHRRGIGKVEHCICAESIASTRSPTAARDILVRTMRVNGETFKMETAQILLRIMVLAAYAAPFLLLMTGGHFGGTVMIAVKYLCEHLFLAAGAAGIRRRYPLIPNLLFQVLYPAYLVAFGLAGAMVRCRWR